MPKLPEDAHREKIGNNYNKRNDEHPPGTDQKILTYLANHRGANADTQWCMDIYWIGLSSHYFSKFSASRSSRTTSGYKKRLASI
ncbi:hypothetical protein [Enterococcus mundtii]|uniref:hypothetical protein n=1 Tax=Enterococcus mundtii TaxID=53346 RepID=UPI0003313B9F|nr:hypothetical protein [Enterococcus mundtii]EOH60820.1 hypothetical protein UAC_02362 [Enterococcus mundtii ATCC 882]EOU11956.1 hypothetical protein I587_00476 [Enterococcus mundtii ATCC 882]